MRLNRCVAFAVSFCIPKPDESTILQFRHLLETHGLTEQIFNAINQTLSGRGFFLKAGAIVEPA